VNATKPLHGAKMHAPAQNYDRVAIEYYDQALHPTCADFRDATRLLLDRFLAKHAPRNRALELGAGKSLVAESYAAHDLPLTTLTITDASAAMLKYSASWRKRGAKLVVSAVETLSNSDGQFDLIFACLGDPYNTPRLWQRIRECLAPHGAYFYTTPSFDWATRFRRHHQGGNESLAEFLVEGEHIYVPSLVISPEAQRAMIEAGGLTVGQIANIARRDLPAGVRSPKLALTEISADLPIVTGYWGGLRIGAQLYRRSRKLA
jgi:2-polyprenyl-3-methyl-5-hydroxy-6-metoxy-1,4-benzoquinol methylase